MTTRTRGDAPRKRKPLRLSKRGARIAAWFGGSLSFFTLWASIGLQPKPPAVASEQRDAAAATPAQRQEVLIKRTVRRVVVTRVIQVASEPQVRYVTVVAPAQTTSSTTSSGTNSQPPAPVQPPPTTDTKGS